MIENNEEKKLAVNVVADNRIRRHNGKSCVSSDATIPYFILFVLHWTSVHRISATEWPLWVMISV